MVKTDGVRLWKVEPYKIGDVVFDSPYPWRFEVTYQGITHGYAGVPNYCATKREAAARAGWRYKWLREGTHDKRYKTRVL